MNDENRENCQSRWIWGYSDRLSARPGDTVDLCIAGTAAMCRIDVARLGRDRREVRRVEQVPIAAHPIPPRPHEIGCGWPVAHRLAIPDEWPSGYYEILLTGEDGAQARHFVCVKASAPRADVALVLATNTYHAYNWWGGANTYLAIGGPVPVPIDPEVAGPAARLSTQRPFSAGILKPASPRHRIVNERRRGFDEPAEVGDSLHEFAAGGNGWDCPAGFTDKWEHAFVAWAEGEGLALDYLTDHDLDLEPEALAPYRVAAFVGHSEYWSWDERHEVERFVDEGGRLLILSGNTCYWQCRFEDDGRRFVAYKSRAESDDPLAADPLRRERTSGLWSSAWVGKPEAQITGLSFLYGGYHRLGMCVSRGIAGYTVWRPEHWAFAGTDLFWGDVFGDDCRLVGYENDGCPFTLGEDGLPQAVARSGVPPDLEILATAPCTLFEPEESPYSGFVPPEAIDVLARALAGHDSPSVRQRLRRGHAVLATFRRGRGEVFNSGTTEWAYGLQAGNPFVERITRNVLDRFLGQAREQNR